MTGAATKIIAGIKEAVAVAHGEDQPAAVHVRPTDDLHCEHGDADCACLARNVSRSGCLWSFPAKAGDQ